MKVFIETLGCPKNLNDSEMAAGIMENAGHSIVKDFHDADIIMVNTCGFIKDAKVESIDRIFDFVREKKDDVLLIVSGCLTQRYADDLYKDIPEIDIFIGVNDYERLPDLIKEHKKGMREKHVGATPADFTEARLRKLPEQTYSMTLKIAEGCDNACAYCVIPAVRGRYRSRRQEDLTEEAELLAANGCKELIIIAQDVTAYGKDIYGKYALPDLLRKLCKIDGIVWIRLMYCYEERITDELIDVIAEEEKICNYIDIPLQHCSDRVLKSMGRRSTAKSIADAITALRNRIPGVVIRTTLIIGLPGETEKEFEELVSFVKEMRFERLGTFAYSREEGTAAAEMPGQIDEAIKKRRQEQIMRRQNEIAFELNKELIGKKLEVLVEGRDLDGRYFGRTRMDAPEIDNSVLFTSFEELKAGDLVYVMIEKAYDYDIEGRKE